MVRVYERLRSQVPPPSRFIFMTGDVINERIQQFLKRRIRHGWRSHFSANFRMAISRLAQGRILSEAERLLVAV